MASILECSDKYLETAKIRIQDERQINYQKGVDFERYVALLFNKYISIKDWTNDSSDKKAGIEVESDKNPDFTLVFKPRNKKFAVECKYRSYPIWNNKINDYVIHWSYPGQIQAYNKFSEAEEMPVFIVIGLGGTPDNPEYMYCIPLDEARYPAIYPSVFNKHKRVPTLPFFWCNGRLV